MVVAITLAAAYALLVACVWLFQRSAIYFPERLGGDPRWERHDGVTLVPLRSPGGPQVYGLWNAPPKPDAPVALILHGNGGCLLSWSPLLESWKALGCGAFLLDPRGYGWSEGSPTEEGLLADAEAAMSWLAAQGVAAERVVLHGISIGGGVALPLAGRHAVRGLVLEAPFTRLSDVAFAHWPFLPFRWILRDRYDNLSAAASVTCPVLILHGDADEIVPVEHSERLAKAFPRPPTRIVVPGLRHNDLTLWSGHHEALERFLGGL